MSLSRSLSSVLVAYGLCHSLVCSLPAQEATFVPLGLTESNKLMPYTYDLREPISAYRQATSCSEDEARTRVLTMLFATPESGQPSKRRTNLGDDSYRIWASQISHNNMRGVLQWIRHGKQICLETRVLIISESARQTVLDRFHDKWDFSCCGETDPAERDGLVLATAHANHLDCVTEIGSSTVDNTKVAPSRTTVETVKVVASRIASLNEDEAQWVTTTHQANQGARIQQAPKVTVFPDQQALIKDTSQHPFVVSVYPIKGDHATAFQPVIRVFEEGLTFNVRASLLGEKQLQISGEIIDSRIGEVESFTFEHEDSDAPITVQLPEYHLARFQFSKVVEDGRTLLIDPHFVEQTTTTRWGRRVTSRTYTMLLVTPRILSVSPFPQPQKDAAADAPRPLEL